MQTFNHLTQIILITYHNQPAVVVRELLSITCLNLPLPFHTTTKANHSIKENTHTYTQARTTDQTRAVDSAAPSTGCCGAARSIPFRLDHIRLGDITLVLSRLNYSSSNTLLPPNAPAASLPRKQPSKEAIRKARVSFSLTRSHTWTHTSPSR